MFNVVNHMCRAQNLIVFLNFEHEEILRKIKLDFNDEIARFTAICLHFYIKYK